MKHLITKYLQSKEKNTADDNREIYERAGNAIAKAAGNKPETKAKTLGISPKKTASNGPRRKTAKISDMLTNGPVTSWLWITVGKYAVRATSTTAIKTFSLILGRVNAFIVSSLDIRSTIQISFFANKRSPISFFAPLSAISQCSCQRNREQPD